MKWRLVQLAVCGAVSAIVAGCVSGCIRDGGLKPDCETQRVWT